MKRAAISEGTLLYKNGKSSGIIRSFYRLKGIKIKSEGSDKQFSHEYNIKYICGAVAVGIA